MLYDKELVINGEPKNSPEQQVWQNMKDIQMLKSFIKPIYQTTATLTDESTGVLIADTNAPVGTKVGWILTEDGLFFQIEDSNETSFLLKFLADLKGPQGDTGETGAMPDITANATIDANVGTPSVSVVKTGTDEEPILTFNFSNMKGETGSTGATGPTPVITANASVDSNVGTPSVSVTKSGTDANPVFTFAFHNLKGDTGTSLISVQVVSSLPSSGDAGTLYFVPNSGSAPNQYDEYIWLNSAWEKLGTQTIDLSNYIQKSNTNGLVKNDGTIDTTAYTTLNLVYPVGSIYMSVNNTNPGTLFGGTWEQLKDRFLLGAGDTYTNGATGGEATHQLTTTEMPSHSHGIKFGDTTRRVTYGTQGSWDGNYRWLANANYNQATDEVTINNAGGGQAHNNMPPYLVVYMWKRTA